MIYTLRPCTEEDFEFIFKLKVLCFKWYVEKIYGWDEEKQRALTHAELLNNLNAMRIIQVDGKDAGLSTFSVDENNDGRIGLFAILPEFQGQGIGTRVLQDIISDNPNRRLYLKVYKENPARHLYERVGFKLYGETITHYLYEQIPH